MKVDIPSVFRSVEAVSTSDRACSFEASSGSEDAREDAPSLWKNPH